ncbi:MAG: FG-GAP repeat domain-containing protein, partial [Phycisphaerae bacterium]
STSRDVSILLGNGDGTFAADVAFTVGDKPVSVAIGDLNGNGHPDLAVANRNSDNISVLLGNGDGTFAADVTFGAGDGPVSVAIGDLDEDGYADLAVANVVGHNVSVLLSHGDGTFATDVIYGAGNFPFPRSVAIGDLNGDGHADLAVANSSSDNVLVLLGHGDGTFAAHVTYGVGDGPLSVAIGDLDGDGHADLAVANGTSDNVSVLLNRSNALPIAMCRAFSALADNDCCITVNVSDIDDGSFDTDGLDDIDTLCITAVDGTPVPCLQSVQVCGDGPLNPHTVTLTITDLAGAADSCDASVTVLDCPQVAAMDIHPGSCPNIFDRIGSGSLPVALLGTAEFDVTQIDQASLTLSRADGVGGLVRPRAVFDDVGRPFDTDGCTCRQLRKDGIVDLSMKFRTDNLAVTLELKSELPGAQIEMLVTGLLNDGQAFVASDCIRMPLPGTGTTRLRVTAGADDRWIEAAPPDLAQEGGGFGTFERLYPTGSIVTLDAPKKTVKGMVFDAWVVDGARRAKGVRTLQLTVVNQVHEVKPIYRRSRPPSHPTPGRQTTGASNGL